MDFAVVKEPEKVLLDDTCLMNKMRYDDNHKTIDTSNLSVDEVAEIARFYIYNIFSDNDE